MVLEPNNLLSEASDSGVGFSGVQSAVLSSRVNSLADIDLYEFQLNQGQGITLDIDTVNAENNAANFDSYLRVFDVDGNELSFNDDYSAESEEFSLDSYIGFIANQTGEYYVGVSSIANSNYNPLNGENVNLVEDSFLAGDYDLTLNIVDVIGDEDNDNTISEAIAIEPENILSQGYITTENDVDLYSFTLEAGKGINLKLKADNSDLDSFLRLFDSQGNELVFSDNSSSDFSDDITTNAALDFAPDNPGEYFIGVSSAGNFNYDAVNGDTNLNLSPSQGISTGNYELELNIVDVVADNDPDNTIAEAIDSGATSTGSRNALVSGAIDPELDVDIYQVTVAEGDGIYLDLDAAVMDSNLDSFLRLFDSAGNELTFDDNDDFNFTEDLNKDSALIFAPATPGEYFVGVSASGNFDYDPVRGRNNFSPSNISPFSTIGNYDLQIDIVNIVIDEDPNNTILEAIDSGVTSSEKSAVLDGDIHIASDADIYKFQLEAGDGVTVDLSTADDSSLDSYLRLFDQEGQELAFNDDNPSSSNMSDSSLNFVAENSGEYFIGVSSEGNAQYDAVEGKDNFTITSGFSTGSYELGINVSEVIADEDPDNTIAEAIDTEVSFLGQKSYTVNQAIASLSDSDIYEFELAQGEIVTLDIDAAELNTGLDSVLRLFDADGSELIVNDDNSAPGEGSSTDSFMEFAAPSSGKYYVGVSGFSNFTYDPVNGSNNFSNDIGSSMGNYNLAINIIGTTETIEGM